MLQLTSWLVTPSYLRPSFDMVSYHAPLIPQRLPLPSVLWNFSELFTFVVPISQSRLSLKPYAIFTAVLSNHTYPASSPSPLTSTSAFEDMWMKLFNKRSNVTLLIGVFDMCAHPAPIYLRTSQNFNSTCFTRWMGMTR
jgi:hypothetical protein